MSTLPNLPTSKKLNKKTRRRLIRWGVVAGNIILLMSVGIFVIVNRSTSQTVRSSTVDSPTSTAGSLSSPLDQLSSSQIALTAAQMTRLPELTAVRNQADSEVALLSVIPSDTSILAKPQVVTTAEKSKQDIISYVTKTGDTVSGLAAKYNITADSIRWSNGITGDGLNAGVTLYIPPVNGIVYVVKSGDTPASLAQKYHSDENQIIVYNDAEISGLQPGERIIVPNGTVAAAVVYYSYYSGVAWGSGAVYGSSNGYDFGYCTWYAANRRAALGRPVPSNLGNARTWYRAAVSVGLPAGFSPQPGAVMVNEGGNHVSIVEVVNSDGSAWISEMNSYGQVSMTDPTPYGGWDRVNYKLIPASSVGNYKYIY